MEKGKVELDSSIELTTTPVKSGACETLPEEEERNMEKRKVEIEF